MSVDAPRLTFFCELEPQPLTDLFARREVLDGLKTLRAGVSLGLIDLSAERAAVVRLLNETRIPVTAWLLLPQEQGYFQHVENAAETAARFDALREWSAREALEWAAIGLDVEQDRRDLELFARKPWRAVTSTLKHAFDEERLQRGLEAYQALIERMRAQGWVVESYQFPALVDDRQTGSRLLQRAFGLMDLRVDREVWMLYSSILPPRGPGWLASYGPQARSIALGSTGGGIDSLPKLGWAELRRDLLLARRWTDALYVFSLEGCVAQGLLPRIASLDWAQSEKEGMPAAGRWIDRARWVLRAGLEAERIGSRVVRRVLHTP